MKISVNVILTVLCFLTSACKQQFYEAKVKTRLYSKDTPSGQLISQEKLSIGYTKHILQESRFARIIARESSFDIVLTGVPETFNINNIPYDFFDKQISQYDKTNTKEINKVHRMFQTKNRVAISIPYGTSGTRTPYFFTTLKHKRPWKIVDNGNIWVEPKIRPVRVEFIKNQLGLNQAEIVLKDQAGIIAHLWVTLPKDFVTAHFYKPTVNSYKFPISGLSENYTLQKTPVYKVNPTNPPKWFEIHLNPLVASLDRNYPIRFEPPGVYHSVNEKQIKPFKLLSAKVGLSKCNIKFNDQSPQRNVDRFLSIQLYTADIGVELGCIPLDELSMHSAYFFEGLGFSAQNAVRLYERKLLLFKSKTPPSYVIPYTLKDQNILTTAPFDSLFILAQPFANPPHLLVSFFKNDFVENILTVAVDIPSDLIPPLKAISQNYNFPIYRTHREDKIF